jgi:hypothetical protein
MFVIVINVM